MDALDDDDLAEEFASNYPFHRLTPSSAEAPFTRGRSATDISLDALGRIHGTGSRGTNVLNPLGTAVTREDGTIECWQHGRLHREDGPAFTYGGRSLVLHLHVSGFYEQVRLRGPANLWFREGRLHREGGPAVQDIGGSELWYLNGRLHRTDGPAIVCAHSGMRWWCLSGEAHRDEGPAVVTDSREIEWGDWVFGEGAEIWFRHGKLHRDNEPAMRDSYGNERWYRDGRLHREDGPAELNSPDYPADLEHRRAAWFINGREIRVEYWAELDDDDS